MGSLVGIEHRWKYKCGLVMGYFTEVNILLRRCDEIMEKFTSNPNPYTGQGFPTPALNNDPIVKSNRLSLPFPREAASNLGNERGTHGSIDEIAVIEAQQRMYLMASMMGVWDRHDDPPTAA